MNEALTSSERQRRPSFLGESVALLVAAFLLLVLSNGRWILPLAAWLAPVLILRYFRTREKLWKALLFTWLLFSLATPISWFGLWPFPPLVMLQMVVLGSVYALIPYFADRVSRSRLKGFAQTLVFPCVLVAVEFINSLRSATTWGNIAYTQTDNLPLLQLASVTGIWGITFLIAWLAPVINNLWDEGFSTDRARKSLLIYASVVGLVLISGASRLVFFPPSSSALRVATVTPKDLVEIASLDELHAFQRIFSKQPVSEDEEQALRQLVESTANQLFADTRVEAQAGAEVVVWPEAALVTFDEAEDAAVIGRAQRLATEEEIYLVMTVALVPVNAESLNENRILLIGPKGEILQTYYKTFTVPVVEEPFAVKGSGHVAIQETPFGHLAGVICYDMDSPRFLRGAGQGRADILFAPSGDWPDIKLLHTRMALVRAVEQGFSLVRPANHGINLAADYQGRILAQLDHYATSERRMSAWVPREGVSTLYTRIGDTFAWICLVGCFGLFSILLLHSFRKNQPISGVGTDLESKGLLYQKVSSE